jgi:hypothetical protein
MMLIRLVDFFSVGRDGLTHNMLNDIHNNWKSCEAVRVKCLGVPTVDMQNVCHQLEVATCLLSFSDYLKYWWMFSELLFDVLCVSIGFQVDS